MAEVQMSGPINDEEFTDDQWEASRVDGVGIANDYDGTAFGLTLPGAGDTAQIASGFIQAGARGYRIPGGQTQSIDIPASTNAAVGRTDVITARYDAALNVAPLGPVRIHRIAGVEGSGDRPTPTLALSPGGTIQDLPLYAITRKENQALADAAVVDLRIWKGQSLLVSSQSPTLYDAPLGSRAVRGGTIYRRDMVGSSPAWVTESSPVQTLTGLSATATGSDPDDGATEAGWQRQSGCRMVRDGGWRWLHFVCRKGGSNIRSASGSGQVPDQHLARLHSIDRPPEEVSAAVTVRSTSFLTYWGGAVIAQNGDVKVTSWAPDVVLGPGGPNDAVALDAVWRVS